MLQKEVHVIDLVKCYFSLCFWIVSNDASEFFLEEKPNFCYLFIILLFQSYLFDIA